MTNIIPLVAQSDQVGPEELSNVKSAIMSDLHAANIRSFLGSKTCEDAARGPKPCPPYAISSATSNDADNMDASLLMSPDYVQPLLESELRMLVEQVFERDTVAWLRHCAAKKLVSWWRGSGSSSASGSGQVPQMVGGVGTTALTIIGGPGYSSGLASPSQPSSSPGWSPIHTTGSYALAKVADHTQREDRMAHVRLAKWASDLQRSMQNERERYEALMRRDRLDWLTDRLGECVRDGTLALDSIQDKMHAKSSSRNVRALVRKGCVRSGSRSINVDRHDPLGLLGWNAQVRQKGWMALQVVSSFGIIGGLALWVSRYWGAGNESLMDWGWDWNWWSGSD